MAQFVSQSTPGPRTKRSRGKVFARLAITMGASAALLAACSQAPHPASSTFDPRLENYDIRHPIVFSQEEEVLELMVGAGAEDLTPGDQSALRGFVQQYSQYGEGAMRVLVPSGSANEATAAHMLSNIHAVVAAAGGHPGRVLVETYRVSDMQANAPIRVVFDRTRAVTNECGQWMDDMSGDPANRDFWNFGCTTQSNMAAMLTDPRDLVRPRGMGAPDASRRATVLEKYRSGEPTGAQSGETDDAAVSQVGN